LVARGPILKHLYRSAWDYLQALLNQCRFLNHFIGKAILFICLLRGEAGYGQTILGDSTAAALVCLQPGSVVVAKTYVPSLWLDTCAQRLVQIKEDNIEMMLYKLMKDPALVLAVHVILTRRHHMTASLSESFEYQKDSLTGFVFTYNRLKWSKNASTGEITLSQKAVKKCEVYWRKKIGKKKNETE
jgi:hypothetical protein